MLGSDLEIRAFSSLRIWVYDLEATGLDTTRERVTQIAGLPIEGGKILEDEAFVQLVHPGEGVEISKEVEELTGITLEKLKDAPSTQYWRGKDGNPAALAWVSETLSRRTT